MLKLGGMKQALTNALRYHLLGKVVEGSPKFGENYINGLSEKL